MQRATQRTSLRFIRFDKTPRSIRPAATSNSEPRKVPRTREEVLTLAGDALQASLGKNGATRKSFKKTATPRFAVELPVADESPESVIDVVARILDCLRTDHRRGAALAFHDIEAALLASERFENEVLSLQDFQSRSQAGILVITGIPTGQEEAALAGLRWRGLAVVLISLDSSSIDSRLSPTRNSFQTVFAYEPFATKGLLRTTEGLIYKRPQDGKGGPWLIFKKSGGEYKLIGRTNARPTATDVENAMYNASAAESPLTQGLKAIKSLASRGKQIE